jgi:hypothetical protein
VHLASKALSQSDNEATQTFFIEKNSTRGTKKAEFAADFKSGEEVTHRFTKKKLTSPKNL